MHPVDSGAGHHFRRKIQSVPKPSMAPEKIIREVVVDKAESALHQEFKKWEPVLLEYDDRTPIPSSAKHHCRALFFAAMAASLTGRVCDFAALASVLAIRPSRFLVIQEW